MLSLLKRIEVPKIISILLIVGLFIESSKDLPNDKLIIYIGVSYVLVKAMYYLAIYSLYMEDRIKDINIRYFIIGIYFYSLSFKIDTKNVSILK